MVKVSVWQRRCCKIAMFGCHEILRNLIPKWISKANEIGTTNVPISLFEDFGRVRFEGKSGLTIPPNLKFEARWSLGHYFRDRDGRVCGLG